MNRIAAAALASTLALAVAGCGPTSPPVSSVTVYWEFDRITFIDGVDGFIPYDTNVNWPPGTGSRPCPQAGVDFVTITDLNGNLLVPSVSCVNQSVQGAVVTGFPGDNTYVVTGWRNGQPLPFYRGQVTVSVGNGVLACGTFDCGTAIAAGIPDALTVDAVLADSSAPTGYRTCGQAGIQLFTASIEDGLGSLVWRNPVPCGVSDIPGVSFGLVDRDVLSLWIDAWDRRPVVPQIVWSICQFDFSHFVGRENRFFLTLPLGVCTPPPP
jgi:hypothetical protein